MVFFHKHNVHASNINFTFAWDQENSWNHILNKNLLIEGITRYIHEKKQKQSFREVFSWESHETLMSFRRLWENMRFSPGKKLMRNSHENVIFSWKSHENLTRFLWVFSSREKNEILMSKKARERFSWELENSHENVIFSWESREILTRIQKLVRIFERVDPFCLIFLDKDLCGQISTDGILYDSNLSATYLESVSSSNSGSLYEMGRKVPQTKAKPDHF